MSDTTIFETFKNQAGADSEAPVLGSTTPVPTSTENFDSNKADVVPETIRVRYFKGNMDDGSDIAVLEDIMNRSLRSGDNLTNQGDVIVISEQGTFDKDGCYHFVIKYMEMAENTVKENPNL